MDFFYNLNQQQAPSHWSSERQQLWHQMIEQCRTPLKLSELVEDESRNSLLKVNASNINIDCSRNLISTEQIKTLQALLNASDFSEQRKQLFNGGIVNPTEERAALHTALRDTRGKLGTPAHINQTIEQCLIKMRELAASVRNGTWHSSTGETITDVVNIGIGGSDLGPRMVTRALTPFCQTTLKVHFVANADPADLSSLLPNLNPARTLFIVCSKSFQTQETKLNALRARQWLLESLPQVQLSKHFIGVTTNIAAAIEFGLDADNLLPLWDWVGGRYSVWSAIGLSVMMAIGSEKFDAFLEGAHNMDQHFLNAPISENAPVLLACLSIMYCNGHQTQSQAIIPYAQLLEHFPSYLQQLIMESNGKSCFKDGSSVSMRTCPIIWGYVGTNSQHSFHQLLHQGTQLVPIDFILCEKNNYGKLSEHQTLQAHCLAQMQALLQGRTVSTGQSESDHDKLIAAHRYMPGNRPSSLITLPLLNPYYLGALIALYEHRTFVESCFWDINPFDQWGVELGKVLSQQIETDLNNGDIQTSNLDSATQSSITQLIDTTHTAMGKDNRSTLTADSE